MHTARVTCCSCQLAMLVQVVWDVEKRILDAAELHSQLGSLLGVATPQGVLVSPILLLFLIFFL